MSLRLKQIPYSRFRDKAATPDTRTHSFEAFVIVPSMMPRPILKDNFNITYRKIPVVMIGKEVSHHSKTRGNY